MAAQVVITRTIPLFPHGVFLQWDVQDASESGTYTFEVFRSGNSEGPWTSLATVTNNYNWRDTLPTIGDSVANQLSLAHGIYYRVRMTTPSAQISENVMVAEPQLSGRNRLIKRKILRDQSLALRKLNGLEVAVLKKMHWGPRCTKCYDSYTGVVIRANCTTCYGTSFMPGYYTPVITLARSSTPVVETQLTEEGLADEAQAGMTLLDVPLIERDDLLVVLSDNRRFIVKAPIPGKLENVTVFQRLQVMELPRSNIEYRVPVDTTRIPPLF
jgi:hypothetical protein